jgi:membrane-associated phospholipid phosphatase
MRSILHHITDLGDSAFLLPASALLLVYLLYLRAINVARIWVTALGLCAVLTLGLKLAFFTCGHALALEAIHSPSGHTSLSTTFYGCTALMMTNDKGRAMQIVAAFALGGLALAVAASRILLQAHTTGDVILGLSIGVACVVWFITAYPTGQSLSLPWQWVLPAIVLLAVLSHGTHWNFEGFIAKIAAQLRLSTSLCA